MTTQTEALKLADRLLDFASEVSADFDTTTLEKAADELRRLDSALAQPKPEPAFYYHDGYLMTPERAKFLGFPLDSLIALYTTPPQLKPLTNKQRKDMGDKYSKWLNGPDSAAYWYFKGVDDAEAAHNIKE